MMNLEKQNKMVDKSIAAWERHANIMARGPIEQLGDIDAVNFTAS